MRKYTLEEAKEMFAQHGFELLATEYQSIQIKMPFICFKHSDLGIQYCSLSTIKYVAPGTYSGCGCKKCIKEARMKSQIDPQRLVEMRKDFQNHGLNLLDNNYKGVNEWYRCSCAVNAEHGEFKKRYTDVKWQHQGCPICGHKNLVESRRLDKEEYRQLVEEAGYVFVDILYNHRDEGGTYIKYICPKHHDKGVQQKKAIKLRTQGCPYCAESNGEKAVIKYLNKHNILYKTNHYFDDLRGIGNGLLTYDFFVVNRPILIEYQGRQHREPVDLFGGEKQFEIQQEHDRRKREYAKNHGYQLLEIWFDENVDDILDSAFSDILEAG